jgi:hypothetical protein
MKLYAGDYPDLDELRDTLVPHPELLRKFDVIRYLAGLEHELVPANAPTFSQILERFLRSLPTGLGKAYLLPEQVALDHALEIDFRTMSP